MRTLSSVFATDFEVVHSFFFRFCVRNTLVGNDNLNPSNFHSDRRKKVKV